MKIAAVPDGHGGDRSALPMRAGARVTGGMAWPQLRSVRGAGAVDDDELSVEVEEVDEVDDVSLVAGIAAGATFDLSVVVVVVVVELSLGAVLFSVLDGSVVVVVLLGAAVESAGWACVVVVVVVCDESVVCATARPIAASRPVAAARADNFF